MERHELLTSPHLKSFGLKYRPSGAGGADMWLGLPIWDFKTPTGDLIVFRGTFSSLKLAGYFNSQIRTVGDVQDIVRLLTGYVIPIENLII